MPTAAAGSSGRSRAAVLAGLFLLHALPFASRPAIIGGDEPHYALMAHSLAVDGDIQLSDDYREVELGSPAAGRKIAGKRLDRHLIEREGRLVFAHPVGLPLLVLPLVAALHVISPSAPPDLLLGFFGLAVTYLALLAGWDLLARELGDRRGAGFIALAFYFSTPLWFYSRTFFTEPYIWAFAVLAIWSFWRGWWTVGSLLLGFAFLLKETAAVIVLPVLLFLAARYGLRRAARASLLPVASLLLYCVKNRWVYEEWFVPFHPFTRGEFLAGAFGVLLDLRHGLLPFAPLVLLAVAGAGRHPRGRWSRDPAAYAWAVFGFYLLITAAWSGWEGGSCYGPRLMLPALAALALPLARAWKTHREEALFRRLFFGLLIFGFTVQWCAATDPFRAFWSVSLPELVAGRRLSTATGLVLGTAALLLLRRRRGMILRA